MCAELVKIPISVQGLVFLSNRGLEFADDDSICSRSCFLLGETLVDGEQLLSIFLYHKLELRDALTWTHSLLESFLYSSFFSVAIKMTPVSLVSVEYLVHLYNFLKIL